MAGLVTETTGLAVTCPACGHKNSVPYDRLSQATACGGCQAEIAPVSVPVDVSSAEDFDGLVAVSPVPVLVDFWAPWCGPCRMVAPEMQKVAAARAGRLVVAKVNTEEVPELAERYGVYSIPTIGVFANGQPVAGTAGARPARAIEAFVDEAVEAAAR